MPIEFRKPQLNRINLKIERVEKEISRTDSKIERLSAAASVIEDLGDDLKTDILAKATHNIYNGIEQILEDVANAVDGGIPQGDSTHSALLEQMAVGSSDRPPLIQPALLDTFSDLRRFRHLYRHSYGIDLRAGEVEEKYKAISGDVWPSLLDALETLRRHMDTDPTP